MLHIYRENSQDELDVRSSTGTTTLRLLTIVVLLLFGIEAMAELQESPFRFWTRTALIVSTIVWHIANAKWGYYRSDTQE